MNQKQIHLPKPCNENWNKMTSEKDGKYCDSCKTTVVDFTQMSDEKIIEYFEAKKDIKICGHFKSSQLNNNSPKIHKILIDLYSRVENNFKIPILKSLVLSAVIFCMTLVGCKRASTGTPVRQSDTIDTSCNVKQITTDTIITTPKDTNDFILGKMQIKPEIK